MTNAELAILNLVVEQPRHGYEIEQIIEARGMRGWTEIGFSSIYYLLKKLEEKGLLESRLQNAEGRGPARKIYQVTPQGQSEWYSQSLETLRNSLALLRGTTFSRQPVPFLMGLSVFPALAVEDRVAAIDEYINSLEDRLEQMQSSAEKQRPIPPHVEAMFDYSQTLLTAEIDWLKSFLNAQEEPDDQN